jgi:predicted Zn-dependent protease
VVGQGTIDELQALGYLGWADLESATNVPEPSLLPDPKDKIEEQNLLHLAMIASEDDRSADARESLKKVLHLDPKSPVALRQLGELELRSGDYLKSAQHLKGALEVHPDDAAAAFYEGQTLEKIHDLAGARDAFESSLRLMPGQLERGLHLGKHYLTVTNAKTAAEQVQAALLLESSSVEGQLGIAKADIAEGRFDEAAQQLEPISKSHSRNADVLELLAQAYSGLGMTVDAQRIEAQAKLLRSQK